MATIAYRKKTQILKEKRGPSSQESPPPFSYKDSFTASTAWITVVSRNVISRSSCLTNSPISVQPKIMHSTPDFAGFRSLFSTSSIHQHRALHK